MFYISDVIAGVLCSLMYNAMLIAHLGFLHIYMVRIYVHIYMYTPM